MKIFISAAETSSDHHGAKLLFALKTLSPHSQFFGIGGDQLQKEGLKLLFHSKNLSVMGFVEVVFHLPRLLWILHKTLKKIQKEKPDIAIVMDYPGFHFMLTKRIHRLGIPIVYYIPPKVWAWKKRRIQFLKKYIDLILCIFPFEKEFYQAENCEVQFVGNPLCDELPFDLSKEQAQEKLIQTLKLNHQSVFREKLYNAQKKIILMPGSRPAEVRFLLPVLLRTVYNLTQKLNEKLLILVPVAPGLSLSMSDLENKWKIICAQNYKAQEQVTFQVFQKHSDLCLKVADVGIIKSGTSTLEAALLGCRHIVVYAGHWISEWIFKNFINYKGPVALSNLFFQGPKENTERIFPEVLGQKALASPELLTQALRLFEDQKLIEKQNQVIKEIQNISKANSPSEQAARAVLNCVKNSSKLQSRRVGFLSYSLNYLVSIIWSSINAFIYFLIQIRVIKPQKLKSTVISIGNLQAGGAGKTPLVAQLARECLAQKKSVLILCRGYGGRWEKTGGLLKPFYEQKETAPPSAEYTGDEGALLHDLVPEAWIGIGANRLKMYKNACDEMECSPDIVILDDGFQNYKIFKDKEIVAITSRQWGEILFRDFPFRAQSADLIVWTKGSVLPRFLKPHVRVQFGLTDFIESNDETSPLWLVTGVGDHEQVELAVRRAGATVCQHTYFPDHAQYSLPIVRELLNVAKSKKVKIAITGKDWVKWRSFGVQPEEVTVLEPQVKFLLGREQWEKII